MLYETTPGRRGRMMASRLQTPPACAASVGASSGRVIRHRLNTTWKFCQPRISRQARAGASRSRPCGRSGGESRSALGRKDPSTRTASRAGRPLSNWPPAWNAPTDATGNEWPRWGRRMRIDPFNHHRFRVPRNISFVSSDFRKTRTIGRYLFDRSGFIIPIPFA